MSNLHRILWIDCKIKEGKFPNCRTISDKFEISPRQAARDIEYMRSSLGAPVEFNIGRNGYYYSNEAFNLPSQYVSEEERRTLSYLAYRYRQQDSSNAKKIALLFARLTGDTSDTKDQINNRVPLYDVSEKGISAYNTLVQAIVKRNKVRLTYKNKKNIESMRTFCPYQLFVRGSLDYVVGFCEYRNEIRIFRLDCISNIVPTNEEFLCVSYFDPSKYKNNCSFEFRRPYQVVLEIESDRWLKKLGIKYSRLDNGNFSAEFLNSKNFITMLLQIEEVYTVKGPQWLRDRFKVRLEGIFKNNFSYDILCPTPAAIIKSSKDTNITGGSNMTKEALGNIKMGSCWTSYTAAAYGALQAAGLWQEDISKLMGMTGMAFHFIIHDQLCPSSVTVYDWADEHLAMMDRIGIHSEVYQEFYDNEQGSYELSRQDAVKRIKESIDKGSAVVLWAPTEILEFGIIYGYDDDEQVFYVEDCTRCQVDPLLYVNLGRSQVPVLFYQIFKGKTSIDKKEIYKASLKYALSEWNKEQHIDPRYGNGRKGYINLINAIVKNDYSISGLSYILAVYRDSKYHAAQYLGFLENEACGFEGIWEASKIYERLSQIYEKMTLFIPFSHDESSIDRGNISEVLELIKQCSVLEEEAMNIIAAAVRDV